MGILNKKFNTVAPENIIPYYHPKDAAPYLRMDIPPYTIGKVVKLRSDEEAEDFIAKQVQYYICRVPGYNIFIVEAGYYKPVEKIVQDWVKEQNIQDMCEWYKKRIENKRIINQLYKLKN